MANRRKLKREISQLSSCLFAECFAMSLYGGKADKKDVENLLASILRINNDFTCRVSHPEPGMPAKKYFQVLINDFNKQVDEIVDHINNLH